jgi:KUP system potassium uptake protein
VSGQPIEGYAGLVTELVPSPVGPDDTDAQSFPPAPRRRGAAQGGAAALLLAALGVVYGDIGTSPLYALQTVFVIDNRAVQASPGDVYGVISLIFWSLTLIVSTKYVIFILRADNNGEGGVMALAALARRAVHAPSSRALWLTMVLGVLGASLFYGDSVITPAISVLSAVEGLEVSAPDLAAAVVPAAAGILTVLFAVQRWGTARVGSLFGPVMLLWFTALGVAGLPELLRHPNILLGLSPGYALGFLLDRPSTAFIALGAVVLSITGAEALYADLGHFGRTVIRRTWFLVVFPALTVNYLAQGGLILNDAAARQNPFFLLFPHWARMPMVVLATAATVIASQAVISGAFSMSRQAVRLGFLPHLRIQHTSQLQEGQVYVQAVNWALFAAVLALVLAFRSSTRLATAYGVAVTGTFLITTALFLTVARARWKWRAWRLIALGAAFGLVELTYFAANLTKVAYGGWLTLLIATVVFAVMTTWQGGREIVTARRIEKEGPILDFIDRVHSQHLPRVPGTAVFPHSTKETAPLALRANVDHFSVLHQRVIIISGWTANVPHIPWQQRLQIDHLGDRSDGIVHIAAAFGFQDRTDFPEVIRRAAARKPALLEGEIDPERMSYFLSRIILRRSHRAGMPTWRKRLFITLAHNSASQADFLCLPDERTVVIGSNVDL